MFSRLRTYVEPYVIPERVIEEWHELADGFSDGRVQPRTRSRLTLECTIDDVLVRVEHVPSLDRDLPPQARIQAQYLLGTGPAFRATPNFYGQIVLGWLGIRRHLGVDERFDAEYSVKCRDRAATRRAFGPRVVKLALDHPMKVRSNGRFVTCDTAALTPHPDQIVLAAAIAATGRPALEAARSLDGARYEPPAGPWDERSLPRVAVPGPGNARFSFATRRRRLATIAEAVLPRPYDEPIHIRFRKDGSPSRELPRALAAGAPWRRAALAGLDVEGRRARLRWPRAEEDPERLQAGLIVLWRLAQAGRGPYR